LSKPFFIFVFMHLISLKLKPGDKVIVIAPAGKLQKDDLTTGIQMLRDWGLDVVVGAHVFDGHGFFSATDENRLDDIQQAINRSDVNAIFCARGGFGIGKFIDKLDLTLLKEYPKWLIGFSDITLLHFKWHNHGILSVHGPMVKQYGKTVDADSTNALKDILFGESNINYDFSGHSLNQSGRVSGELIGGNLSLIANNIGTATDTDFTNKILFVEEVNESIYEIDRLFNQLLRSGKLPVLAGLIVGQFTDIKGTTPPYLREAYEVISGYISNFSFPVLFDFPSGHGEKNMPLVFSSICHLECGREKSSVGFNL